MIYAQIHAYHIFPNVRICIYIYIYLHTHVTYVYSIGSHFFWRTVTFRSVKTWPLVGVRPGVQLYSRPGCCHQLLGFSLTEPLRTIVVALVALFFMERQCKVISKPPTQEYVQHVYR